MNLNVVIGEGANIPARPQEIMRNIFSQADASLIYIFRGYIIRPRRNFDFLSYIINNIFHKHLYDKCKCK